MLNYRRDTAPLLPKIAFIATSFPSLTELGNPEVLQMEPESKAPSATICFFPYTITTITSPPLPGPLKHQGLLHKESSLQAKEDLPKLQEKLQTQKPQASKGQKKKKKDIQNTTNFTKEVDPVRFTISGPDSGLSPGFGLLT